MQHGYSIQTAARQTYLVVFVSHVPQFFAEQAILFCQPLHNGNVLFNRAFKRILGVFVSMCSGLRGQKLQGRQEMSRGKGGRKGEAKR